MTAGIKITKFTFDESVLNWNSPNKTKKQKDLLSSRGKLLSMRLGYPLSLKIKFAERRIRDTMQRHGEQNCYVGFSGGKDSTVLSHLVLSLGYKLEHVYANTRLEYPECISFSKKWCKKNKVKLTFVLPEVLPHQVWKKYGYPMFSKDVSELLERIRNGQRVNPKKLQKVKNFLKYKDVKLSPRCCDYLKTRPLRKWRKESGKRVAILGTRVEESHRRRLVWIRKGCVYETKGQVISNPIVFFTEKDVYDYAKQFGIKFADIYKNGIKRNGCFCCGFGCHLTEDNNFVKLKRNYPVLWKTVMNKWGFRKICNQCDIKAE